MSDDGNSVDKSAVPTEALKEGAKLSLIGGGVVLVVFLWLVYNVNEEEWATGDRYLGVLLFIAFLFGLVHVVLKVYDAELRRDLIIRILTSDLSDEEKKVLWGDLSKGPFTRLLRVKAERTTVQVEQPTPTDTGATPAP